MEKMVFEEEEGFPMFPRDECIVIDDNIFIHKPKWEGSEYKLWFVVDVQYFQFGMEYETEEEARWHAKMLKTALDKIRK